MTLIRPCLVVLLFFAFLCQNAWCEAWTHKGQTYSHGNGLSVTFPPEFKIATEKNGTLNATAQGGFVSLVFTPVSGKDQMKEAMKGIYQVMNQMHVSLKSDSVTGNQNGVDSAFQEGETTINTMPFYVKLGIFNKKDSFFLVQLLLPKKDVKANEESIKKVFSSVK